jgi:DNA mismatch repair protein mutS (fragment)
MSDIIDEIEEKDINNITPMEALKFLSELKAKLEEKK